jgi:DNA repair photolyase
MPRLKVIYEPKGKAFEYAPLAANLWDGCPHRCAYCYVPNVLRTTPAKFHGRVKPRKDVLRNLEQDCKVLKDDPRPVLLSFSSDPFPPEEDTEHLTREAVSILRSYNLRVRLLTKAPNRALHMQPALLDRGVELGTTITSLDPHRVRTWEPGAPSPVERLRAMQFAHVAGIRTWLSVEPMLDWQDTLTVLNAAGPFAQVIRIGVMNHCGAVTPAPDGWWESLRRILHGPLFKALGVRYYIKDGTYALMPRALLATLPKSTLRPEDR